GKQKELTINTTSTGTKLSTLLVDAGLDRIMLTALLEKAIVIYRNFKPPPSSKILGNL
ncbi:hypothetical protein BGZ95_003177, partial [Linnemannia exigua]